MFFVIVVKLFFVRERHVIERFLESNDKKLQLYGEKPFDFSSLSTFWPPWPVVAVVFVLFATLSVMVMLSMMFSERSELLAVVVDFRCSHLVPPLMVVAPLA